MRARPLAECRDADLELMRASLARALARAARVFRQESIRTALRQAQTPDAVLAILSPGSITDAA